jgi:WhiB family redox-sensing transcriptional regulator
MSTALEFSPGAAGPALKTADWRAAAACKADPGLFFGPDGETASERERREAGAKALCAACPVSAECLRLFRAIGAEDGVWGGLSEADRGRSYAGSRSHKPAAERERLEAMRAAGERPCSGACGQVKPLGEFPAHGGVCRPCLSERMRAMNLRRTPPPCRACKRPGCGRPVKAAGLCNADYVAQWHAGRAGSAARQGEAA